MPRQLRHHVPGGWYHLTTRGIGRCTIFETDREHFLELLGGMVERYSVILHAYVLTGNHYHLLVESPEGNVSRAMQWQGPRDSCCQDALRTHAERDRSACRNEGQGSFVCLRRNQETYGKGP